MGGRWGESKLLRFVHFDISSQRIIDSVIAIYLFCFSSDKWSLKCLIQPWSLTIWITAPSKGKTVSSQYFKPLQMIDLEMKWQPFCEHALHRQISNWCFVCEGQQSTLKSGRKTVYISPNPFTIAFAEPFLKFGPARAPYSFANLSVVGRMSHLPCCDWPGSQWGSDAGACSAELPVMTTFNQHLQCDLKQLLLNLWHLHLLNQPPLESSTRWRQHSLLGHE